MNPLKNTPLVYCIINKPTIVLFSILVFVLFVFSMHTVDTIIDFLFKDYGDVTAGIISTLLYLSWLLAGILIIHFFLEFSNAKKILKEISTPHIPHINDLVPGVYEIYGIQEYVFNGVKHSIGIMKCEQGKNVFAFDLDVCQSFFSEDYRHIKFPIKIILEGRKHFLPEGKEIEYSVFVPQQQAVNELDG